MMKLILLEFYKMIRKKSFYICFALIVCYCAALYSNQTGLFRNDLHMDADGAAQLQSLRWGGMLQSMIGSMFMLNLFIVVAISPLFSEEHTFQMNALLFASKYGRTKCFIAKTATAYLLGLALSVVVVLSHILVTLVLFGGEGLLGSIQSAEPSFQGLAQIKTIGSAILDAACLYTADVFITIGMTILASVLTSHVLTGTVLSAAFFITPMFFANVVSNVRVRLIMPAAHTTCFGDVLSVPSLHIGWLQMPYSYVAVVVECLLTVLVTAGTARIYQALPEEGITWFEV